LSGVVLALLLASGPCDDVTLTTARLAAARSEGELASEVTGVETQLGATLIPWTERSLPLEVRAARAAARAGTACALHAHADVTAYPGAETVTKVLDRPAFAGSRDRHPHAWGRLWERLKEWALSLLEDNSTRTFAAGVRWAVLALALGVAAAGLERWWARRKEAGAGKRSGQQVTRTERLGAPVDHLARARGRLPTAPREALREGLLALLASLERRGLGRADRAETNAEILSALPARGANVEEAERLRVLLRTYDRRFYSLSAVERGEAEAFLRDVEHWETSGRAPP
jgi:hypothetical protein